MSARSATVVESPATRFLNATRSESTILISGASIEAKESCTMGEGRWPPRLTWLVCVELDSEAPASGIRSLVKRLTHSFRLLRSCFVLLMEVTTQPRLRHEALR